MWLVCVFFFVLCVSLCGVFLWIVCWCGHGHKHLKWEFHLAISQGHPSYELYANMVVETQQLREIKY